MFSKLFVTYSTTTHPVALNKQIIQPDISVACFPCGKSIKSTSFISKRFIKGAQNAKVRRETIK